jgi:predicted nuclease of predicted toxin-antitoxin system
LLWQAGSFIKVGHLQLNFDWPFNRILITNDKDFGEKVYRQGYNHVGIILLRLVNERSSNKIAVLKQFLESYSNQIDNNFIVVNEGQVRFAKRK